MNIPCHPFTIPTAWNNGRSRKFIYLVKVYFLEKWFNTYDEANKYAEGFPANMIVAVLEYEIEI